MSASLPRILCIGAQKAGTSWLYENLRTNPLVWSPPFKELHFFDYKFVDESKTWARWHVKSNIKKHLKKPDLPDDQKSYLLALLEEPILNGNWYKMAFSAAPTGRIGIDATPEYCAVPADGIAFIKKFLKNPYIIYIIRDPVERALSQIRMNMYRKKKDFDDRAAWMDAAKEPVISARGDYKTFVPQWDRVFPNLFYAPFGAITEDPRGLLLSVENYCGLPRFHYEHAHRPVFAGIRVEAPTEVVEYLAAVLEGQVRFLRERFGADFVRRTL